MFLSRFLPAPLRERLRDRYTQAQYEAGVRRGADPLMPPARLHSVGDTDFRRTGDEFLQHFLEMTGLRPDERVLDVGCGTGRMARPLAGYLTSGSYDGIDIVKPSIDWCRRAYRRFLHFRFHHSDIYNKAYNPGGVAAANAYRFPFDDGAFDFIFLTSVFTHMLARDTRHYLDEIARVLAPGGRVLITAFLLDAESRAGIAAARTRFTFSHPLDGCFVETPDIPENAVAYEDGAFRAMAEDAGLAVADVHHGAWRGTEARNFQDILIARLRG
ncbi:MAG: hypothetical protein QOH04_707 [Sphingomonadales bacterium]|jgi:ubiquinone/menaquinone biosynthesis C-methylase UbiE|nr:hypothetical protein [Sphingomonadales bacterium]